MRAIYKYKELLIRGCRLWVESGDFVRVWDSYWLSILEDGFVTSNLGSFEEDICVKELMLEDYRCWDSNVIASIFNEVDQAAILLIPFTIKVDIDDWYLLPEQKGSYTVKLGYRPLCQYITNSQGH